MQHMEEEGGKKKRNDFNANELISQILMTDYRTLACDFLFFFYWWFLLLAWRELDVFLYNKKKNIDFYG